MLLQTILKEIKKHSDGAKVIVFPGGYGADEDKQFNFYKKNGFIESESGVFTLTV